MDSDKIKYTQQDQMNMDQANNMQPMHSSSVPAAVQITPTQHTFRPVGPKSMEMNCPSCHCRITTTVRHRSTFKTHIACLLFTGMCCCCLPYCMDTCRNANHFCPMCGTFLGTYAS